MPADSFPTARASFSTDSDSRGQPVLRELGARAHQLRAATRAADHFNSQDSREDRNTGSWLMSCALDMSDSLASDLDGLARTLKERPADAASLQKVAGLRMRAHQLHAAAKAADYFLDQDSNEDRDTGSWLIATAYNLAQTLASEIDDGVSAMRRPAAEKLTAEAAEPPVARRVGSGATPVRGAA